MSKSISTTKRVGLIAVAAILAVALTIALVLFINRYSEGSKEKALQEARDFKTTNICADVITRAKHKATGVEYDFPSSCIPAGWERSL